MLSQWHRKVFNFYAFTIVLEFGTMFFYPFGEKKIGGFLLEFIDYHFTLRAFHLDKGIYSGIEF